MWCSIREGIRGRDAVAYALNNYIGVVRAKILGHKDIRMTQHYAQVSDKSILADMAAVERRMAEFKFY